MHDGSRIMSQNDQNMTSPPAQHRSLPLDWHVGFVVVMTLLIAQTTIRIEWLNHEAEGYLPRSSSAFGTADHSTWRCFPAPYPRWWRMHYGPRDENDHPATRALTSDEQAAMTNWVRRMQARDGLRRVVSSWGLAQYLLVPAALLFGVLLTRRLEADPKLRGLGWAAIVIAAISGILMFCRGYIPALGW